MSTTAKTIEALTNREYRYGFITDIEADTLPPGLNEDVIRLISAKKHEPEFMLDWRLRAYRHWAKLERSDATPRWANVKYPAIDYQTIVYYSAPKRTSGPGSLDEVDPELLRTFEKLGIPLEEQKRLAGVAVDAVFDSVSIATTWAERLRGAPAVTGYKTRGVFDRHDTVESWRPAGRGGAAHGPVFGRIGTPAR